jgi:hypothetical protein
MKNFLLIIAFITITSISVFSQTDTLNKPHKFGCSFFGGLGIGENTYKSGFANGLSARAHYKFHTINAYYSLATKSEQLYGKDFSNSLYSNNYGITYGLGAYEQNFSCSFGLGVGYFQTSMKFGAGVNLTQSYYEKFCTCAGVQFSIHGKYAGFGFQAFFNSSNVLSNNTFLAGLEIFIR